MEEKQNILPIIKKPFQLNIPNNEGNKNENNFKQINMSNHIQSYLLMNGIYYIRNANNENEYLTLINDKEEKELSGKQENNEEKTLQKACLIYSKYFRLTRTLGKYI